MQNFPLFSLLKLLGKPLGPNQSQFLVRSQLMKLIFIQQKQIILVRIQHKGSDFLKVVMDPQSEDKQLIAFKERIFARSQARSPFSSTKSIPWQQNEEFFIIASYFSYLQATAGGGGDTLTYPSFLPIYVQLLPSLYFLMRLFIQYSLLLLCSYSSQQLCRPPFAKFAKYRMCFCAWITLETEPILLTISILSVHLRLILSNRGFPRQRERLETDVSFLRGKRVSWEVSLGTWVKVLSNLLFVGPRYEHSPSSDSTMNIYYSHQLRFLVSLITISSIASSFLELTGCTRAYSFTTASGYILSLPIICGIGRFFSSAIWVRATFEWLMLGIVWESRRETQLRFRWGASRAVSPMSFSNRAKGNE